MKLTASVLDTAAGPADEGKGWFNTHRVLSAQSTSAVADLVMAVPHGVIRWSPTVDGAVDTSNALSIVSLPPAFDASAAASAAAAAAAAPPSRHGHCSESGPDFDHFTVQCFYRSFSDYQMVEFSRKLRGIARIAGTANALSGAHARATRICVDTQ